MNLLHCSRRDMLMLLTACAAPLSRAADSMPSASIYQLDVPLTDQNGRPFRLADLRGELVLASMFYSSCEMVCPMLFETIHLTLDQAGAAARRRIRVLMVSFDPQRDTVPQLKKTAALHHADERWTLARPDDSGARKIAAALGVQYRRLASGEFNHSSTILLLDPQGRIDARSGVLGRVDPALLASTNRLLAAPAIRRS